MPTFLSNGNIPEVDKGNVAGESRCAGLLRSVALIGTAELETLQ
jgi:hypothetical protein